ncbi:DNA ligase (ATP) [Malassezia sp. CBS 17886]|nr:DNA ligase (ATP) [Malassezia sp. CBS 17886]
MAETSVFETTRMTHEEIEQLEGAIGETLSRPPKASSQRLRLQWELTASQLLDKLVTRYESLHELYDKTDERDAEWDAVARQDDGDVENGPFAEFYARLGQLQDHYRKYPEQAVALQTSAAPSILLSDDMGMTDMEVMDREFSGEEMGGRFLDLYVQYETYINLKGVTRISYLDYIARLDNMVGDGAGVSPSTKRTEAYQSYLSGLRSYLDAFLHKTRPLEDMDVVAAEALEHFDADWDAGRIPGWQDKEVVLFGRRVAGDADSGDGIWCYACRRSYAKRSVYEAHLSSERHKKLATRAQNGARVTPQEAAERSANYELEQAKRALRAKLLARDEVLVHALATALQQTRDDTRANVERKAALTDRERQEEAEALAAEQEEAFLTGGLGYEEEEEVERVQDDREDRIYNPLKLPLGFDGRPIPYWMYKLHGLSVEYKCEICSDHIYRGRKIFAKHFQESRHAFGMRALGLPNTPQFRDITRIQDAVSLYEKLKLQERVDYVDEGDTEEVEDEHGNAYTRKTYELLKRQGLL